MKIDILSSDGIHASEKEAIKRMVEVSMHLVLAKNGMAMLVS